MAVRRSDFNILAAWRSACNRLEIAEGTRFALTPWRELTSGELYSLAKQARN